MKQDNQNVMAVAEKLVAYGRKRGADEIEVTVQDGTQFSVNVREQAVERLTEAGEKGASLRVLVSGKQANASSSDLSEATMARLIDNAITRARLGGADPCNGLPETGPAAPPADKLGIFDEKITAMAPELKIAFAKKLESIGMADKRVKKCTGSTFGTYTGAVYLANSKGFAGSYRRTFASAYVGFQSGEGDNLLQDGWGESSATLAGLPDEEKIAGKAAQRVIRLIGARKVDTQKVPMVMEPPMTARMMMFLAQCLSGASVDRKQSFLVDKLGQKIGGDLVTVVDDGLLPGGLGTVPFDAEGVPARSTTVVQQGVLKSYLLNTYYGRKLKLASTGHAGGPRNFYLSKGESSPGEIVRSLEKGLLLTGIIGLGQVPTTGDISVGAFGLWVEKGEVAFPVAEITISGNLGEMLQQVQMVGDDLRFDSTVCGPTIKVAEISVGGKGGA